MVYIFYLRNALFVQIHFRCETDLQLYVNLRPTYSNVSITVVENVDSNVVAAVGIEDNLNKTGFYDFIN